uniref:DUF3444 domain-containing protein n=1 Tax=Brassica campestris TaxID=3711 RepID=A0A3P5Z2E8_BRACM|nr:unnamed protein product [Brassica rapa]
MDKAASHEELIMDKLDKSLRGGASEMLFSITQLRGIHKHNKMVEANLKSRSKALELKEKELQTLSSELKQKVETFEKEKAEAGDMKKLVEECAEELRLKRNELTAKLDTSSRLQREIEVKRSQWTQHSAEIGRLCSETSKKRNELAVTLEQVKECEKRFKMKSLELASKEKDLEGVRESIEVSDSELEVKQKMVISLNNEIDSKSKESREIKRVIEQQTSELVVIQKQLDSIRSSSEMEERAKEIKDKEKELELLKHQIESEEKKLLQLKREKEVVTGIKNKDLELTLSKIEESSQHIADVNEKLESQRRQLEMQSVEQVSKQMELESLRESSKRLVCDLDVKEKRLQELNNLIKLSGEQLNLKSKALGEIERELKLKRRLRQMSTVLVNRQKQPISSQQNVEEETELIDTLMPDGISASLTRHEVSSVLRATPNPAGFVLEQVQDGIREGSTFQDKFLETLVLIFEELVKIQGPDESQLLQLQATEVATLWKERITIEAPKSTLEALAFLLFIIAYGLKTLINEEETALLASSIAQYGQAPRLFVYLSLNPKIREFVEELIKKGLYIPAVRLICLFNLDKEDEDVSFSRSELLKKEIITFRRSALENRSTESSQEKERDGGRLRAILELVADYKLKIDLPGDLIAKLMVEGERSAPVAHCSVIHVASSSNPQAGLKKKKQLGQTKTVLVKHTGVKQENLAGRPQIGAEIPKPDILKPQPEEKEPQNSAGKSMPDLSAPKTKQTARKKRKSVEESSMSFEVDGSDAAVDKTDTEESNKRKPQVSYAEKRRNSDSVIPPTKKTKSGCEVESDVNTKQTDEDNTSLEPAEKGKAKESENSGNNNIFSGKNKGSEGCDRNGEDAALSSKMSEVENGHNKADENRNTLEIPDPEFNVFEDERRPENFAVNQVWSTCDSRDGMPRRYARVRKVLSSDFKLRVTYLKPVQENNDESIPVTWGKFNNGETKDVEKRSIFSGQMLHSVCNRVVSIYPRKGEIWAMFSDWDEESSTLENHELPYKYDFVEIVNDFKEEAGIGAAYLGKVKGFVSLFQREAKNTVCQVQFAPERMLRFSHKVPAVKMTGMEKEGVPPGSYELDPTALPKDIFQVEEVNVEMDSETMKGKADSPYPEAPEIGMKTKPVPEIVPSPPRKRQKSDDDGGCSNRDKVCSISVSIGEVEGEASRANGSSSCQVNKKSVPNGSRKSGEASDAFKLRKSPRLQTTPSQQIEETKSAKQGDKMKTPKATDTGFVTDSLGIKKSSEGTQQQVESLVGEGSKKRGRDGERPSSSKQNDLPAQLDGSTSKLLETTPASSSCKTPQRNAFDFNNERSVDKFRRDQTWAIYSDDKGMPTEYVKIKKVETKPELVLHVAHMELCPPSTEPVTRSVSCGEFKMETGKPKTLPLTRFSHRVKPFDSKQKIVKVYPRKGDIWALRKSCDSTEEEHDIVEVVEGYCEGKSIKAMALTAKGFSSIYTRKHGSHVSSLVIPKAEMSRFSHQVPAVKQEKRATRLAEGGYWELDPAAIPPPTTIVID